MQRIMLSNQDCSLLLKTMFRGFTGTNDAGKAGKESSFFISPIPTPPLGRTGKIRHSSAAPVGERQKIVVLNNLIGYKWLMMHTSRRSKN